MDCKIACLPFIGNVPVGNFVGPLRFPRKQQLCSLLKVTQSSPSAEESQAEASSIDRVEAAEAELLELQRKVERERQAFSQISAKLIASTTHFDLQVCSLWIVPFFIPSCSFIAGFVGFLVCAFH